MRITTYGEDGLTLWALASRLEDILLAAGDTTSAVDATVLFRPSFGRRAPSQKRRDVHARRKSQFGEFDAIIGTEQNILALEFKRQGCSEYCMRGDQWAIELRAEQYRRHEVFDWYVRQFSDYIQARSLSDQQGFIGYLQSERRHPRVRSSGIAPALPPSNTTLARNLEYVIGRVLGRRPLGGRRVQHIVVYVYDKTKPQSLPNAVAIQGMESAEPELSNPDEERLELSLVCLPLNDGSRDGFVDLDVCGSLGG